MKPTLCIVNFNGREVLAQTLPAALAVADLLHEVLVVDNGSTDGSIAWLQQRHPQVRLLKLPINLGAGGARNAGLRAALSDLVLFIDNDVSVTRECVESLVAALSEHRDVAMASAAILYAHRRDTVQYDGGHCHFLGLQALTNEDVPVAELDPGVRDIETFSTCCFIADRRRLPSGAEFDESFFYMFEDHDFSFRVRILGSRLLAVPRAVCFHGKGTEGLSIRQLGTYSERRVYFLIRNRWLFLLKNYSLRTLLVLAPLLVFYEIAQGAIVIKKRWGPQWRAALGWIVINRAEIRRKRALIQANRTVSDRQVLCGGRIPFRAELAQSAAERLARSALDLVAGAYWALARHLI